MKKIRFAVVLDAQGNWSVAGTSDQSEAEMLEAATDSAPELAGGVAECFVTATVPLPQRLELEAATLECRAAAR